MTVLASLACQVSATGISRPAFSDILDTLYSQFRSIYGTDSYIAPDSQDGQLLAAFAKAIDDSNAATVAVYNSFSPATSQGAALSNNVKINGMKRAVATNSTAPVRVTGQVGTVITGGVAGDSAGNRWLIPDNTVIPPAGFIDVTATAETAGAIAATSGSITTIQTPILGWQAVTNTGAAVAGAPVESDAALRKRQTISVALPSRTVLGGILGAVAAVVGVTQARVYENDSNVTDANGLPAHSIAVVALGGLNTDIANAISAKKTPGCYTQGTTSVAITDVGGNPQTIRFYVPTQKRIIMSVAGSALNGYVSSTGTLIKAALAAYVNGLGIGKKVDWGRLFVPAQLTFGQFSDTFEINTIQLALFGGGLASADVAIAFNELATLDPADITLTIT
jgi:uncharacterized phage protein gp47/JayE